MSNIGNRQIMSRNLLRLMAQKGKTRVDVASETGIKYSTLCDWINCNKYPRIDNIERLANYFGVKKSALTEEPVTELGDGYDDKDRRLIDWFRSLPPEKQKAILTAQDAPEGLV